MSFDEKCFDLAGLFLGDEPALFSERNKRRLAQAIQDTIEDWIATEKEEPLPDPDEAQPQESTDG